MLVFLFFLNGYGTAYLIPANHVCSWSPLTCGGEASDHQLIAVEVRKFVEFEVNTPKTIDMVKGRLKRCSPLCGRNKPVCFGQLC
jgi:hypothetical protein